MRSIGFSYSITHEKIIEISLKYYFKGKAMSDAKKSKKKKIIIIFVTVLVLALSAVAVAVAEINKYIDTHTWATVSISGEINSDTADAFSEQREYLKGDRISFSNVILDITDITHNGEVTFSVEQGNLYNEMGEAIGKDTLTKGEKSNYKLDNGTVSLTVTDNRYQ